MNHHGTLVGGRFSTVIMELLVVAAVVVLGFVVGGAGLAIPVGAGAAVAVFASGKSARCTWPRKHDRPGSD